MPKAPGGSLVQSGTDASRGFYSILLAIARVEKTFLEAGIQVEEGRVVRGGK